MANAAETPTDPVYSAGDVLVDPAAEGGYQVSRVSANGRSSHVMSTQATQPAALLVAARATSGRQRVFVRANAAAPYTPVAE